MCCVLSTCCLLSTCCVLSTCCLLSTLRTLDMIAILSVITDYIAIVVVDCNRIRGTRACLDTLQSVLITPLSLSLITSWDRGYGACGYIIDYIAGSGLGHMLSSLHMLGSDSLRVVLDVLWSLFCNQRAKLALHMHPLQAPLDIHPRHSPSALTLFIMVLVLVLYFTCTFNESTTRLRHTHTHMHLSTCTLYEHLSTFTLSINSLQKTIS